MKKAIGVLGALCAAALVGAAAQAEIDAKPDDEIDLDPRGWIRADDLNASVNASVAERAEIQRAEREAAEAARLRYEADMTSFRRMMAMSTSARAATEAGNTSRACELYRDAMAVDPVMARERFQATLDWIATYC